jgi:hypothetical protein
MVLPVKPINPTLRAENLKDKELYPRKENKKVHVNVRYTNWIMVTLIFMTTKQDDENL